MRTDAPSLSKESIKDARSYINENIERNILPMLLKFILVLKMLKLMKQLGPQCLFKTTRCHALPEKNQNCIH